VLLDAQPPRVLSPWQSANPRAVHAAQRSRGRRIRVPPGARFKSSRAGLYTTRTRYLHSTARVVAAKGLASWNTRTTCRPQPSSQDFHGGRGLISGFPGRRKQLAQR
jgi:hypothetical protein